MGRIRLALLLLLLLTVAPLQAQGPTPAVVQQAIDALLASNAVITGNWTCTGTCTGFGGGGGGVWGTITGTLSNQTDLQTALNTKVTTSGSPSSGQVGYFSGASAITGSDDLAFTITSENPLLTISQTGMSATPGFIVQGFDPGTHVELPFVSVLDTDYNGIEIQVGGSGLNNAALFEVANSALLWNGTSSGGLILLNTGTGPVRIAAGSTDLTSEFLRVNTTGVVGLGPFPSLSTMDLGLYRNAAGVLEINSGAAGTFRDLKARDVFIDGEKCPSMQTAPLSVDSTGKIIKGSCS